MVRCPRCQRRLPSSGECAVHGRGTASIEVGMLEPIPPITPPAGWALGSLLAHGGTALVFSVRRDSAPPAIMKWGRWRDRDIHARFALEAEVLRAVGPPATPMYIDHGNVDGWPYLLMEHVPGETLAAWMARHGERGGLGAIVAILTRLAAALAAVHAKGFWHRDLKPENMLIGPQGVRLLDFGLAKKPQDTRRLTLDGTVAGTLHYLAPEQLIGGGNAVDHRADLYSFGVIAYEMLAGQPPYVGERRAIEYNHRVSRPPSLRERRPIPDELEDLVMACLAKPPESRPQSAAELGAALSRALDSIGTLRGVGRSEKPLGQTGQVVLAWIEGGDPVSVVRAITEVQGIVVRRQGDGILAAFSSLQHAAPLVTALAVCRQLVRERCRIVAHVSSALVRRSASGKTTVYGEDLERLDRWVRPVPFIGLLLTAAAAAVSPTPTRAADDAAGMFREVVRDHSDATDARGEPTLVGRANVIEAVLEAAGKRSTLIAITGEAGIGKTRVLAAIVERLRQLGREVITVRGRRRFPGERPDDDRLIAALGGGHDFADAFAHAGARHAIVVIDDLAWCSDAVLDTLLRRDLGVTCIVASVRPFFEPDHDDRGRLAFELPRLAYADSDSVLRQLLRPANLIPDVLVERLAIRASGTPALIVALARDIKRRGAIRRHAGSEDWYVAADELDTLLAPPGPSWFAIRALEDLPVELVPVVRMSAGLGPRFSAEEIAAIIEVTDLEARLAWLVREGVMTERGGWYEFADAGTQEVIYDHVLDERSVVHTRALRHLLANRSANLAGWLARVAYHAAGAGEAVTAAACWIALARAGYRRGETRYADEILGRAVAGLAGIAPAAIAEAVRTLEA